MKKLILSAAFIAVSLTSFAQVGVGTTSPEGALDVVSTDSGFLMPRMADETAVTTPVEGMQVYNTTTDKVMLYDGTQWVEASGSTGKFVDGTDVLDAVYTGGNVGIGTTDPLYDLHIKNNIAAYSVLESVTGVPFQYIKAPAAVPSIFQMFQGDTNYWRTRYYASGNSNSPSAYGIGYNQTNPNMLLISTEGNIGLGGITAPSGRLHMTNGNITDTPTGSLVMSRVWIDNTNTRASAIYHINDTSVVQDQLVFGVSGVGSDNYLSPLDYSQAKMVIQSQGHVGIGTVAPAVKLDVDGYIKVGSSDTAGDSTPVAGMMRFNTTTSKFQGYDGSAWVDLH